MAAALALLLAATLLVPSTRISGDSAIYALAANTHLRELGLSSPDGPVDVTRWPSLSSWYSKPALDVFTTAALFGGGFTGLRLLTAAFYVLVILLTYAVVASFEDTSTALWTSLLVGVWGSFLNYLLDLVPVGLLAMPWLLLATYLLGRGLQEDRWLLCTLAALAGGIAFLVHPNVAPFFLAAAAYMLAFRGRWWRKLGRAAVCAAVALGVVLVAHLASVAYLERFQVPYVDGAPMPYLAQIFDHAAGARHGESLSSWRMFLFRVAAHNGLTGLFILAAAALLGLWQVYRLLTGRRAIERFDLRLFGGLYLLSTLLLLSWAYPLERHFFQLLPFLSLLALTSLQAVLRRTALVWGALLLLIALQVSVAYHSARFRSDEQLVKDFFASRGLPLDLAGARKPFQYDVLGFRVFEPGDGRGPALLAPGEPLFLLSLREAEAGPAPGRLVGRIENKSDYAYMTEGLLKRDPLFALTAGLMRKASPALADKLMFQQHGAKLWIYQYEEVPPVRRAGRNYRYELSYQKT